MIENEVSVKHYSPFSDMLKDRGLSLNKRNLRVLQVNVGKFCNQACRHCHVEAGPTRTEIMDRATAERIIELLNMPWGKTIDTVDITGGAPELNPNFSYLVSESCKLGKHVIDRSNLTVFLEPGQEDTVHFLKEHSVEIVASLPCYTKENVEAQRGRGIFNKSIRALKLLNVLGYGKSNNRFILNLVYNPLGAFLPPDQKELEFDYKKRLKEDFNIEFNKLFTITNMPIKRFLYDLQRLDQYNEYMNFLENNFNITNLKNVMCRELLSISWDGKLYDCDFNQMLEIPMPCSSKTIWDIESLEGFNCGPITVGDHCYGCTAGSGSSCRGELI